ncbi:hypothetical protein KAM576c_08420 [Enterobacter asburiae]|jgi:hypothetical protein|nr:hypothetical protein KAM576c_08420 [Enterobacter asburiae]
MPDVCGTKKASVPQSEDRCFGKSGHFIFVKCDGSDFLASIYNAGQYNAEMEMSYSYCFYIK